MVKGNSRTAYIFSAKKSSSIVSAGNIFVLLFFPTATNSLRYLRESFSFRGRILSEIQERVELFTPKYWECDSTLSTTVALSSLHEDNNNVNKTTINDIIFVFIIIIYL